MIIDIKGLIEYICVNIRELLDIAVIGMSGGADSSLCSILCKLAIGANNVYSLHMPVAKVDYEKFNRNSLNIAQKLGINVIEIPVKEISTAITTTLEVGLKPYIGDHGISILNAGNARARARMCILYGISHELGTFLNRRVRVIGTGNLSEDFIGFDTKGGDALADIFPIGGLYKSEVYQMLDYFCHEGIIDSEMIDRVPSAGLWDNQTDEAELGYSYDQMEGSIRKIIKGERAETEVDKFVLSRHKNNKHKHEAPYVINIAKYREE